MHGWHIGCTGSAQSSEISMNLRTFAALAGLALVNCAAPNEDEPTGESSQAQTTGSCSADAARGAVSVHQKALHDAIAYAEGTRNRGDNDGYDVGFAYRKIASCAHHPNKVTCSGRYCSTAAGRYQFLKRTWDSTARATGADAFAADDQERGAEYLVKRVRKVVVPERAMTATEFSNALKKLSYEWASLPPGRYGQPMRSEAQVRAAYCEALGSCSNAQAAL
jgi:muramidase (phage lysozyme)